MLTGTVCSYVCHTRVSKKRRTYSTWNIVNGSAFTEHQHIYMLQTFYHLLYSYSSVCKHFWFLMKDFLDAYFSGYSALDFE